MTLFVYLVSAAFAGAALYAIASWWLDRLRQARAVHAAVRAVSDPPAEAVAERPAAMSAADRADAEFLSSIGVRP